jgi:hypothetical protein
VCPNRDEHAHRRKKKGRAKAAFPIEALSEDPEKFMPPSEGGLGRLRQLQ